MMNEEAAYLIVEQGPYPQQQYLLTKSATVIGRGPNNDIVFVDSEVSRQHTQILRQGIQDYIILDMGSTNGTFVNGQRISSSTPLTDGATINLGESIVLSFHLPEPDYLDEDETPTGEIVVPPQQPAIKPQPGAAPPPLPAPVAAPSAYIPVAPNDAAYKQAAPYDDAAYHNAAVAMPPMPTARRRVHPLLLGCGVLLLMTFLCTATLFFLDAYDNGRLLYCGGLRPFWQFLLGPFGFAPLCS